MTAEAEAGLFKGAAKAFGTVVGAHLQYAQREAQSDVGRVLGGVMLVAAGAFIGACALAVLHAAVYLLIRERTVLDPLDAMLAVAGGDALLALLLLLMGRARLKQPVLAQTRQLVKKTVSSLAEI